MNRWGILLVVLLLCVGCAKFGRFLSPIQPGELPAAAREQLDGKDNELAVYKAAAEAQLAKLKDKSKVTASWIFYSAIGLGVLIFGASVFYAMRIDGKTGTALAAGSLAVIAFSSTWLRYGNAVSLAIAWALAAVLVCGVVYLAFLTYKKLVGVVQSVEYAKPLMKRATLKALGDVQDKAGVREGVRSVRKKLGFE